MNKERIKLSRSLFGTETVDMLLQTHQDAKWILENLGVGCKQPEIQAIFKKLEWDGEAVVYEDRIYITGALVERCLEKVPCVDDFFVPLNSFFIGGTAPYVYDDKAGKGGIFPTTEHAIRISKIAEANDAIAGMGRGIKLKDEVLQMDIMAKYCSKPIYFAVTSDESLRRAQEIYKQRKNIMIVFCLTRPPLEVNENFSDHFVRIVKAGLPVFISVKRMAADTKT